MNLRIRKNVAELVGMKALAVFGADEETWQWRDYWDLDLSGLNIGQVRTLLGILTPHSSVPQVGMLIRDIRRWKDALAGNADSVKPRSVEQFTDLVTQYLRRSPGHRLYEQQADGIWLAYYINEIEYHPEDRRNYRRAHCTFELLYEEFGGKNDECIVFYEEECRGITVADALGRKGLSIETEELRAEYLADLSLFSATVPRIGSQYLCGGTATDKGMDGNTEDEDRWWRSRESTFQMVRGGDPTRVVIDVFYEKPETDRNERKKQPQLWFWKNLGLPEDSRKDEDDDEPEGEGEAEVIEVPIHPFAAVFDLTKHIRMRTHIRNLSPYEYDPSIQDRLIIPDETRHLVQLLIEHRGGSFQDIIKGKAGGAVVLLTGAPGVGKTLTAEVYAEAEGRALYTVQCSQLGTNPQDLEDNLLKVFARASRWNAVMLLDEADVYVRERGSDLNQNAIVGVFLRVLEYQSAVLFLTTNRPEDVDDAIASRCIARINYRVPSVADQKRIWRVLADLSKADLAAKEIERIAKEFPALSGRDVKNLLKLALLLEGSKPVTLESIRFVSRFKPTAASRPSEPEVRPFTA